jgi:hypothetical protein
MCESDSRLRGGPRWGKPGTAHVEAPHLPSPQTGRDEDWPRNSPLRGRRFGPTTPTKGGRMNDDLAG